MAKTLFLSISPIMLFLLLLQSFSFQSKSLPQTLRQKERLILLKLKTEWRNPPSLSNWAMESNGDHCSWPEVKCATDGTITEINLSYKNLSFPIPLSICDLTNLTKINLRGNNIPGPFPIYLSNCTNLQDLDISWNRFVGRLPPNIDRLSSLRYFSLTGNNYIGHIPPEIGHMSNLTQLSLNSNLFNRSIPSKIGDLENLELLGLGHLSIMPQWRIPPEFGRLKKLKYLWIENSNLIGDIPGFLINLTDLEELKLSENKLRGEIPRDLFRLKNLTVVNLDSNNFFGEIPRPIDCLGLTGLELSMNQLTGTIPEDFSKLVNLKYLYLGSNLLSGEIPTGISQLPYLTELYLVHNNLTGALPPELGLHSNLVYFKVSMNRLSGKLPQNLCHGGLLRWLEAFSNNLSGTLPESLDSCTNLQIVRLHCNIFTGEISAIVSSLPLIQTLELQENRISGELPSNFMWSKYLDTLNLSKNQLTGRIPPEIGFMGALNSLDLSGNQFSGEIPSELGYLYLHKLDLSSNRLIGKIPDELDKPEFEMSFLNNSRLCASKSKHNHSTNFNIRPCDSSKISPRVLASIMAILGFSILLVLAFLAWFFVRRDHKNRKREQRQRQEVEEEEEDLPKPTWRFTSFHWLDFTKDDILNGLVESNIIGSGGSGKVYRISIGNQTDNFMVAVKKIYNRNKSDAKLKKEFQAEIEILGRIRHANIVKLLCCISSQDSMLLVYEYMENGSLDRWLYQKRNGNIESGPLDWPIRLRIAVDAAQGLYYMHHSCSLPIIHRDVKSSNILLDSEFKARIADFGLARMLFRHGQGEPESMSAIAGTFGYIAPEYAVWARANEKSDVYSFGVVLLELATGKKACSTCDGCNGLVEWAWHHLLEGKDLVEALDEELREDPSYLNEMTLVFNLGLNCTVKVPSHRPSMKQVLHILQRCGPPQKTRGKDHKLKVTLELSTIPSYARAKARRA